jgi:ribose transport system substrate-binding protein
MSKKAAWIGTIALTGCVLAGCSDSGSDNNGTSGSTEDAASAAEAATTALAQWYEGTDRALPTEAPEPQAGKNVWVIACASAAEGCAVPSAAIEDAGTQIGWDVTVYDGQFNPSEQANGIRAAIANEADAIVVVAADCPTVQAPLEEAKAAGIILYANFSVDCDEVGGERLFDGWASFDTDRSQYGTYLTDIHNVVVTDWVTSKTEGAGNVLLVDQTDSVNATIEMDGLRELFPQTCPGCAVSTVEFTGQDLLSGNLTSLVAAALTKDPEIDVVVAPYDAAILLGVGPAVEQQVGRDILVAGYEGLSGNIAQIKAGGPTNLVTGFPSQWVGWSTVDELNRMFNGEEPVDQGMGYQAVDEDNNIPASSEFYDGNVDEDGNQVLDYQSNYLEIWGIG